MIAYFKLYSESLVSYKFNDNRFSLSSDFLIIYYKLEFSFYFYFINYFSLLENSVFCFSSCASRASNFELSSATSLVLESVIDCF